MNTKNVLANWNNSRLETIDLEPEDFDRAGEMSDRIPDETQQWQTYVKSLAVLSFKKWLQDQNSDISIGQLSDTMEVVSYLQVGSFKIGIIAPESFLDGVISIPEVAIETAHFYIAIEVLEEQQQSILRGFIRHDKLTAYRQSENLQPDAANNYLIPFSQWETQLDRLLLNLRFLAPSAIPLPNRESSIPNLVKLTQWLDNLFDLGWQTLEELLETENVAWSFRSVSQINRESGTKGAKLLDFGMEVGDRSLALLVAIIPENEEKIGIRIQLHPSGNRRFLPENLSLTMVATTGETIQEVRSRDRDTYIQLRYFKTNPGTQFNVRVTLDDRSLTEAFLV